MQQGSAAPTETALPGAADRVGLVVRRVAPLAVFALFAVAIWVVHRELTSLHLGDLLAELRRVSPARIALAVGLTAVAYLTLTLYDTLALRYIGKRVPYGHTALTSFTAYALSHSVGFAGLSAAAVRFRFYGAWGLSAVDVAYVMAFNAVTLFLGSAIIMAAACVLVPGQLAALLPLSAGAFTVIAALLTGLVATYLGLCALRREPVAVRGWRFTLPPAPMAVAQLGLAVLDWNLAAAVLYISIPSPVEVSFLGFVGLFTVAAQAGVLSHVPGGVGVFEAIILTATGGAASTTAVAAGLVLFRLVYHVLPLVVASLLFAGRELAEHRHLGRRLVGRVLGRVGLVIAPNVFGVLLFIAGAVLLASGATPADPERLRALGRVLPLGAIELAHVLAGVVGLALLLVAWGLRRRLDGAWRAAVALLAAGLVLALLRGIDYEEAALLGVVLLALLPCRDAFHRRAALLSVPPSPGWLAAVAAVVLGTAWLGFFGYRHAGYGNDLWWRFALDGDAPRFLRATAASAAALVLFSAYQLRRAATAAPAAVAGGDDPVARARGVIATAGDGTGLANLALVGDKRFLFSDSGRSFIMYGVEGRSWIALGEPVGQRAERVELLWRFRELADGSGGRPAFYQVPPASLPEFVDLGLSFYQLGERAVVPLAGFSLDHPGNGGRRDLVRRLRRREGCALEVLPAEAVPALIHRLRAVSDAWLAAKGAGEKGFAVGRFDPAYLASFPAAVVRRRGRIIAFATLWPTPDRAELSVDLLRYDRGAPEGLVEYLFTELMLWGRDRGYARFDLGMAPAPGLVDRRLTTLWSRAGAFLFRHGEHFEGFRELRRFKEGFDPVWEPRYLAAPGGFAVARVLTDLTLLIGGGLSGVLGRERVRGTARAAEREPGSGPARRTAV